MPSRTSLPLVMNNARIEQSGPAREVFNARKTEFVARFLDGHNVLSLAHGMFALRADAVRLEAKGIEAVATAVEFQGAHVALTARMAGDQEILTQIPEAAFYARPKSPGKSIHLCWADSLLHRLSA